MDPHLDAGAFALDAIEDDVERRRFERHLLDCATCRQEVRELRETAAALGVGVAVRPPPALRERVLAEIAQTPQLPYVPLDARGPSPSSGVLTPRSRRTAGGRRRQGPLVAAAVFVLVAGTGLAGFGALRWQQAQQAERQAQRILSITADPAAKRSVGKVAGGGSVSVVVSGRQAVLLADGVTPLSEGRIYQLWLVRPSATVSAGLGPGGVGAGGRWSRLVDGVRAGDSVAISVEPSGGSLQPTTQPVTVIPV